MRIDWKSWSVRANASSPMRIVLLSNMGWTGMGQTNRQAWAHALSTQYENVEVLYIETLGWQPTPQFGSRAVAERIRVVHAWNFFPRAGRPTWWLARGMNSVLTWLQILWNSPEFLRPDLLITFDPLSGTLVRLFKAKTSLYDCLDLYAEQPQYSSLLLEQRTLNAAEQKLAGAVNRVSVSAQPLVSRFSLTPNEPIYCAGAPMPLGINPSVPGTPSDDDAPIQGLYIGALDHYKVDFDVFFSLLDVEPRLCITLIGKTHHASEETDRNLKRLELHERVEFLEPVARESLPMLLEGSDFGIIAMRPGAYSDHSFPLKLWDYLEAGVPVLASGSRAMAEVRPGVVSVSDASALSRSVLDEVLAFRELSEEIHNFAVQNSALFRVQHILKNLDVRLH